MSLSILFLCLELFFWFYFILGIRRFEPRGLVWGRGRGRWGWGGGAKNHKKVQTAREMPETRFFIFLALENTQNNYI